MMDFKQFCQLLSELTHVPHEKINESSSFRDDLGIDSLQMVNVYIQLSQRFAIGLEQWIGSADITTVGGVYHAMTKGGIQS